MGPICRLSLPWKTFRRYFGMITTWYLQSQRTWDKLCHSCIGSSFLPRGAFPEGRAYAFSQRWHAGSLEALRVSRPEAVVLVVNKGNVMEDLEKTEIDYFGGCPLCGKNDGYLNLGP